jgi:hypothetical protein
MSPFNGVEKLPLLYRDLAEWFHLVTPPEHYADEAAFYREMIMQDSRRSVRAVLELGSGGGNNASYLKQHFQMTLVDLSGSTLLYTFLAQTCINPGNTIYLFILSSFSPACR